MNQKTVKEKRTRQNRIKKAQIWISENFIVP